MLTEEEWDRCLSWFKFGSDHYPNCHKALLAAEPVEDKEKNDI